MGKTIENIQQNNLFIILKGTIFAILITIILLFAFALLLAYTNISESLITPGVIILSVLSILIGSIISSRKLKRNGLINGGTVGLIYITCLYLTSSILQGDFSLNIYSAVMIFVAILIGLLGGIIGVNMKK